MSATTRTTYQGRAVNELDLQLIKAANKMLATKKFGGEKENATMLQGGYNRGGVAASAGTHDGGGAFDFTPYNVPNRVKVFRLLGVAYWDRPYLAHVWNHHNHGIVDGDTTASAGAKQQVSEYHARRNGLANRGRDTGYQMKVFPKFVYNGVIGTYYAKVDNHVYEQPTVYASNLGAVKAGDSLVAVAIVAVGSDKWLITADGKCAFTGNYTTTKPVTPPVTPTPDPVDPTPDPTPTPTKPTVTINYATQNVIMRRLTAAGKTYNAPNGLRIADVQKGANWLQRVKPLASKNARMKASIIATQEAGGYAEGDQYAAALGPEWKNVLHGDPGDLCNTVTWDNNKRTAVKSGLISTIKTGDHIFATWAILKDVETGFKHMVVSYHAEYRAKGSKSASVADKNREAQINGGVPQIEKIAKDNGVEVIVWLGDFNSSRDQFYDGIGKAFDKHSYTEVERVAKTKVNGQYNSTWNIQGSTPTKGARHIDRAFFKASKGATVTLWGNDVHVEKPAPSDHWGTYFTIVWTI